MVVGLTKGQVSPVDLARTSPCRCISHNGFLTRHGYEQLQLGLAPEDKGLYLDRVVRVTALEDPGFHVWDDSLIDQQERSFHNGS